MPPVILLTGAGAGDDMAMVTWSLYFALGPGDVARDVGRRSNLQGGLACTRPCWG